MTNTHTKDYVGTIPQNPHVVQCAQCWNWNETSVSNPEEYNKELYSKKDCKFFSKIKERNTYRDGTVSISEAPDRFYCSECMSESDNGYEGYSYEEWSDLQPIQTENLLN